MVWIYSDESPRRRPDLGTLATFVPDVTLAARLGTLALAVGLAAAVLVRGAVAAAGGRDSRLGTGCRDGALLGGLDGAEDVVGGEVPGTVLAFKTHNHDTRARGARAGDGVSVFVNECVVGCPEPSWHPRHTCRWV